MRTVRSAARSRNRPRTALAWLIAALALGLVVVMSRLAAADAPTVDDCAAQGRDDDACDELDTPAGSPIDDAHAPIADAIDDADFDPDRLAAGIDSDELADVLDRGAAGAEAVDLELRHQRPSRWGRLDLAVAWRRHWDDAWTARARATTRDDQLWIVATWRR
ncbi:MAG TPA: hypothetical protein VFQ53_14330 [Kofleriaceae bacterium]|nr:hypothetical protein [Kofleriaceae bacterium]